MSESPEKKRAIASSISEALMALSPNTRDSIPKAVPLSNPFAQKQTTVNQVTAVTANKKRKSPDPSTPNLEATIKLQESTVAHKGVKVIIKKPNNVLKENLNQQTKTKPNKSSSKTGQTSSDQKKKEMPNVQKTTPVQKSGSSGVTGSPVAKKQTSLTQFISNPATTMTTMAVEAVDESIDTSNFVRRSPRKQTPVKYNVDSEGKTSGVKRENYPDQPSGSHVTTEDSSDDEDDPIPLASLVQSNTQTAQQNQNADGIVVELPLQIGR